MQPPQPPPVPRKPNPGSSPHSKSTPMPVVPPPLLPARTNPLPWVCLGLALMLFGVVGAGVVWHSLSGPRRTEEVASSDDRESESMSASSRSDAQRNEFVPEFASNDTPMSVASQADEVPTTASKSDFDAPPQSVEPSSFPERTPVSSPVVATSPSVSDRPAENPEVFADLRRRSFQLELPGRGMNRDGTEVKLAAIPVAADESLQLALSGGAESGLKLVPQTGSATDVPTWTVLKQAKASFGGQEEVTLGQFLHKDGELRFQWNSAAPGWSKPGSLQFAMLDVRVDAHRQFCQLWKPVVVNPPRINVEATTTAEVPFPGDLIDRPASFRVQFQLSGTSQAEDPSATVVIGETATLMIGESAENGVEVELKITPGDSRCSLQVKLFGSPPSVGKEGKIRAARQEITPAVVQSRLKSGKNKDSGKKKDIEVKKLLAEIASVQDQIDQKNKLSSTASSSARSRIELELTALGQRSSQLESKVSKAQADQAAAQELADQNTAWCNGVLDHLKVLHDQPLRYAIYVESQQRIIVLESSGFEWKNP